MENIENTESDWDVAEALRHPGVVPDEFMTETVTYVRPMRGRLLDADFRRERARTAHLTSSVNTVERRVADLSDLQAKRLLAALMTRP